MTPTRSVQLSLASRFRERRVALDLTLTEVAERAGLSIGYVSNLELARGNPTVKALLGLSEALEISPASLLASTVEQTEFVSDFAIRHAAEAICTHNQEVPCDDCDDIADRVLTAQFWYLRQP